MDYAKLAEMQQNPISISNPNPNHNLHPYSTSYPTNPPAGYVISDPYNPVYYATINPHNALLQAQQPGTDTPYVPPPVNVAVSYTMHHHIAFEQQHSADATAAPVYYPDTNGTWPAAIGYVDTHAAVKAVTIPKPAVQYRKIKKNVPKKTKIVQSAWCEICKIDCNSRDVLDKHKLGKKHKKNLEKLRAPTVAAPAPAAVAPVPAITFAPAPAIRMPVSAPAPIEKPIIGPEENPDKAISSNAIKAKKKKAAATEDLETKRRKVLDGGAAAAAVRTCTYCNVVCNSETVFNYHLAGQKHAAMVRKYAASVGVASVM